MKTKVSVIREPEGAVRATVQQCHEAATIANKDVAQGATPSRELLGHALLDVLAGAGEVIGFAERAPSLVHEAFDVVVAASAWDTRCIDLFGFCLPDESHFDRKGMFQTVTEDEGESTMREAMPTATANKLLN
jgi:hypothetical protein